MLATSPMKHMTVVFDENWLGFKKDQKTVLFEKDAVKLVAQGKAHYEEETKMRKPKIEEVKKEAIEEKQEEVVEVKSLKRPIADRMIKRATVSK